MRLFQWGIVVSGILVSFVVVAYFYLSSGESISSRDTYSQAISDPSLTGLVSPLSLMEGDVLLILGEDNYTTVFTEEDRPPIERIIPVGQEILFGVSLQNGKAIDPEAVKVIVSIDGGEDRLRVTKNQKDGRIDYEVTYTPEKPGEYLVSIRTDGSGYGGDMKVIVFDQSIISDTALSIGDLSADFSRIGIADDAVHAVPAQRRGDSSDGWWSIDIPGHLEADFGDDSTGKGVLKVYDLAAYKDFSVLPEFYRHIADLDAFLSGKDISKQEKSRLVAFPPINASLGGFSHERVISSGSFDGWRYIHHGNYQAVDFPSGIRYVFQGLSKDRKFFVRFERSVSSAKLEKFKRETKECFPYDEKHSCIHEAFSMLQDANDFNPDLLLLDGFVKTIQVKR